MCKARTSETDQWCPEMGDRMELTAKGHKRTMKMFYVRILAVINWVLILTNQVVTFTIGKSHCMYSVHL
jgi:hypothetical protein